MAEPIISVEHLGKKYRISHQGQRRQHATLRDVLTARSKSLLSSFKPRKGSDSAALASRSSTEDFWALKDVSFDVKPGEVLGIIGRNGAGKSTLLKILARITDPTEGRVRIRGRIASLLEVGTGFHPELTGRENIYLNGAILGMSRVEIKRKFDEIVDFSAVEKFLDTPVKRYSSGMYVRLAFAVAAHLEPEILIVDEVLAVGDAEFQKKCLGKMKDVSSKEGRTVLFVSHSMNAIESLCTRVIHIQRGHLVESTGDVKSMIASYMAPDGENSDSPDWVNPGNAFANPWFHTTRFYLGDASGNVLSGSISNDLQAYVYIEGEIAEKDIALTMGYASYNGAGTLLYWTTQADLKEESWPTLMPGWARLRSPLPRRFFNEGVHRLDMIMWLHKRQWIFGPGDPAPSITFTIRGGLSDSPYWLDARPGILAPELTWTAETRP